MSDLFSLLPLGPKQIDQAYPVVQSIIPDLDVSVWRDFAEQIGARPEDQAGIITVQNKGYIHGLFSYAIEPHLLHGRLLLIDNVFVLDLFNPRAVAEALLDAVDGLAARLTCGAIQTTLPRLGEAGTKDRRDWLFEQFQTRGHVIENTVLCKRLGQGGRADGRRQGGERQPEGSTVVTMAVRRERCRFLL